MLNKLLSTAVMLLLSATFAFAQSGTVTGVVTDAQSGDDLPGVNIVLSEILQGTASDFNGEYTISNVQAGTYTIVATFVGYQRYSATIEVGSGEVVHNISLEPSVVGLDDVVVTAFGVQREARALGYGVSEVTAESIDRRSESDVVRSLSGKLPGVSIVNTGGTSGSPTNFTIRGYTSITGSNQPLFVVDGIRFDAGSNSTTNFLDGGGSITQPNRFLDIDPKNIENVTVLKGLSATTIYGEQGRNGVVLISTKSGSFDEDQAAGFDVTFEQGFHGTEIASRPDYQNIYGGGFDQFFGWFFSNWGPRFSETDPAIFGSNFRGFDDDGTPLVNHPTQNNSFVASGFPEFSDAAGFEGYRFQAYEDPIDAFFRTGTASTSALNISGGTSDVRLNVNFSRVDEEGFTPGNDIQRNAFGIGSTFKVSDKLTAQSTFNMSLTDMKTPPIAAGFGSNPSSISVFANVFYTPRNVDLANLPSQHPVDGRSVYYRSGNDIQNPFWTVNNAVTTNEAERYFGKAELDYELLDGVNVVYRLGYDSSNEIQEYRLNAGNAVPDMSDVFNGLYQTTDSQRQVWEHNVNIRYDYQLTEDFTLDGLGGGQYIIERFDRNGIESQNQIIFDFFEHSNFTDQSSTNFFSGGDFQFKTREQTAGLFLDATLGYRDYLYLNLSGRNDWFSTLEEDNRSIFYPSASLSFIASDALDITSDILTYLKLFGGVGTSAGAPGPFSTRNTLASNARAFSPGAGSIVTTNATSVRLGNLDLEPELHTEWEIGVETRLLQNRIGLDMTYYTRTTEDLITDAQLDPSTGFDRTLVNIGEIENEGFELTLNASPFTGNFRWDVNANFFTDRSEVQSLGQDLDRINVAGFTNEGNFAIEGEPFLVMLGSKIRRDDNGTPIVNSVGDYIIEDDIGIVGNPNPDFTLGVTNTFRYKGASLSFQVDYQDGGDIFSQWVGTMMARGLTDDTTISDRNNTFILPGVLENGDPNNIQLSASGVFFSNFGFGATELGVYDATHIRLSEVSVGYDLPLSLLGNTPFKQVTFSLNGNNLWFFAFKIPEGAGFDPNVNSLGSGNSRGFEYLTGPSARRFGGSVRVRF